MKESEAEQKIKEQIRIMKEYLIMNLDREDWHACWDASIDLARLSDSLQNLQSKK